MRTTTTGRQRRLDLRLLWLGQVPPAQDAGAAAGEPAGRRHAGPRSVPAQGGRRRTPCCGPSCKRAAAIPSKSILFNIDQKADVISKTQTDALLAVFVKVFDEMCGYYGKQGYIAQFERDLDSRGQYEAFKDAFRQISGRHWAEGREQALLEPSNIAAPTPR